MAAAEPTMGPDGDASDQAAADAADASQGRGEGDPLTVVDDPAVVDPAVDDPALDDAAAAGEAAAAVEAEDEITVDSDAAAVDVEEDLDELSASSAAKERDDYLDALRRLQADFENYKKRVAKQQSDLLERAAEHLVDKLLPVLDTADLALAHGAGEGVKQIHDALSEALVKEGLERIGDAGSAFDPTVHDAVAFEEGDGGGQRVAEVLRAGYRWKGRVVRPAMVKVKG
jgi:molecular chaperone GrpE